MVTVAPILLILAGFTWLLPLAVAFPPGALIVITRESYNVSNMILPTYNGSYMGNYSKQDAEFHSLAIRRMSGGNYLYR